MVNIKNDNDYIIDLTGCASRLDIHRVLRDALDFPEYYGNNLDALWDELSSRYSAAHPANIIFTGSDALSGELIQYLDTVQMIISRANRL